MSDMRDKPVVSYVGDSVVIDCKSKKPPVYWLWYKVNGTEKVSNTPHRLDGTLGHCKGIRLAVYLLGFGSFRSSLTREQTLRAT